MKKYSYKHDIASEIRKVAYYEKNEALKPNIINMAHRVLESQVFRIPNVESLPSISNYKEFYEFMKMPYKLILLEMMVFRDVDQTEESPMALSISDYTEDLGEIVACVFSNFDGNWSVLGDIKIKLNDQQYEISQKLDAMTEDMAETFGWAILQFLVSVNTPNINQVEVKPPKLINNKRKKKGKYPIEGYRYLDLPNPNNCGNSNGSQGGKKRAHWRRGHIRRLSDRTTWVKASLIGANNDGFIDKTYRVNKAVVVNENK